MKREKTVAKIVTSKEFFYKFCSETICEDKFICDETFPRWLRRKNYQSICHKYIFIIS